MLNINYKMDCPFGFLMCLDGKILLINLGDLLTVVRISL